MSYNPHHYYHSQASPQQQPQQPQQSPPSAQYQGQYQPIYHEQQSSPLPSPHYGQHQQPQYCPPQLYPSQPRPQPHYQQSYQQSQYAPQPQYTSPHVPPPQSQPQQQQRQHSQSYVTIRSRNPGLETNPAHYEPLPSGPGPRSATHDVGRVAYHIKHLGHFAKTLEESATKAFPNKGRSSQRYTKVHALLLHWRSDDLFVLPELEDLEKCLKHDYAFETSIFPIPSDNPHLDLMLRVGQLIKDHESPDTLFVVYYGGHARIDDSRQSRWCATRHPDSPWLQWSAIQTLLERSMSDVLILLDCCAGAASATFPTGTSITETISASSWDAIAPDPGRYSFTNALIEVLQAWRGRTFSAAMLHAEVLARLKHPRPILINGKHFEARSTPVHFMMTANHKAPSIEITKTLPVDATAVALSTSPPTSSSYSSPPHHSPSNQHRLPGIQPEGLGLGRSQDVSYSAQPTEDVPHVMISLALEDDQQLDLNAWEQWLADFPAMAKYVKVQGVFKSHSNLLLVSMPVMIWDMLPENCATNFVAFIRSNNLAMEKPQREAVTATAPVGHKTKPSISSTLTDDVWGDSSTLAPTLTSGIAHLETRPTHMNTFAPTIPENCRPIDSRTALRPSIPSSMSTRSSVTPHSPTAAASASKASSEITRAPICNQHRTMRRTTFPAESIPKAPKFAQHVENRLEQYFVATTMPTDAGRDFIASNLGIDTFEIEAWFHHRREKDVLAQQMSKTTMCEDNSTTDGPFMVLPTDLDKLFNICPPGETLTIDLRPRQDFAQGHIYQAVNLRAPLSFLSDASIDMIEELLDDNGRDMFIWKTAACVVFYANNIDYVWECPAAAQLHTKMRAWGWRGRSLVLKGRYTDFSSAFPRYIVAGPSLSTEAAAYIQQLRQPVAFPKQAAQEQSLRLQAFMAKCEADCEARSRTEGLENLDERRRAVEENEALLEQEFKAPTLAATKERGDGSTGQTGVPDATRAQLAAYLDRSLAHLQQTHAQLPRDPVLPSSASGVSSIAMHKARFAQETSGFHASSAQAIEVGPAGTSASVSAAPPTDRPRSNSSFVEVSKSEDLAGMAKDETFRKGGRGGGGGSSGGFLNKMLRRS